MQEGVGRARKDVRAKDFFFFFFYMKKKNTEGKICGKLRMQYKDFNVRYCYFKNFVNF